MNETNLKKNIRRTLVLSVCIVLALVLTGTGLLCVFKRTLNQAMELRMEEEVENYKARIVVQIERNFEMLNTLSRLIGTSEMEKSDTFEETLSVADGENDFVLFGYFDVNEKGVLISKANQIFQECTINDVQKEIQDAVLSAFQGKERVSDIFLGEITDKRVFVFSVPVYHNGKIIGALLASDEVDALRNSLGDNDRFYGSGYIHILNKNGEFLIRGEERLVATECNGIMEEPYLEGKQIEQIQSDMQENKRTGFNFRYENATYSAILEPVGINNWYLFSINSLKNVNKNIYGALYGTALFFGVISIVLILLMLYGYVYMKRMNDQLRKLAYYDQLTGLYNLPHFTELVEERIKEKKPYAIVVLNIRQFKFINESFSMEEADNLLKGIGQILLHSITKSEYVCRESADTFYMYLEEVDCNCMKERLESINEQIRRRKAGRFGNYQIVIRYGVATAERDEKLSDVMNHAMFALEKTKDEGRKDMWFFDQSLHEQEQLNNYLVNHLRTALKQEQFQLYLQPKMDLQTDTLTGAEALVRWVQEDGSILYPGRFIPLFEKSGKCAELDFYMFEQVCKQLKKWREEGHPLIPISINQSKGSFYVEHYEEQLCDILMKYEIPASLITLEILEGMVIEKMDEMNQRLEKLRKIGFRISLDDFGTGYSSLNTVARLNIDELKLDRGFLQEIGRGEGSRTKIILEGVAEFSNRLEITTVIEGIETKEDEQFAKKIGCKVGQGYLYSKPIDVEQFTEMYLMGKERPIGF